MHQYLCGCCHYHFQEAKPMFYRGIYLCAVCVHKWRVRGDG